MAVVATGMLLALVARAAPAPADAAATAGATATGLSATGAVPIPPTPTVTAEQPPDSGERRQVPVDLGLPPLAVTATLAVVAEASRESRVATPAFPELMDNALRRHVPEAATNARAFTRAEGLGILLDGPQDPVQSPLTQTLVSATAVESSAIARCVGDQALFDTDYRVVGLKVLGQDLGLEALLAPVLAGLDVDGVISVKQGEAGPLPGGGIFINALHIVIPLLGVDLIVGRSEARMPTPCAAGGEAEAVEQASPRVSFAAARGVTRLAATGGRSGLFQWGTVAIGAGLALRVGSRRWRPTCWSSPSPPCGRRQPWRRSDGTVGGPPT